MWENVLIFLHGNNDKIILIQLNKLMNYTLSDEINCKYDIKSNLIILSFD